MQRRYAIIAAAAALAVSASPAAAHSRPNVKCGQTLTQSVRLTKDLVNCPGNGLVIGAHGITVDLAGHTLDGVPVAPGCEFHRGRTGVSNAGFDRVTIENGTIRQFDVGVEGGGETDGMSDSRVRGLTLREVGSGLAFGSGAGTAATAGNRIDDNDIRGTGCGQGIELNTGRGNRFAHNRVRDFGLGILICCGELDDGNVVARNDVARSANDGVLVFFSGATRVTDNEFSDLGGAGVAVIGPSPDTVVKDNRIVRAHGPGILVDGEDGVTGDEIAGNTLSAVGDGILLFGIDRAVVTGNTVNGAGTVGDPANIGFGLLLGGAIDNVIAGNEFRGGRGPGIQIGDDHPEASTRATDGNVVTRNEVTGHGADGIKVIETARHTIIERNETDRNGGNGIHVLSPLTTLTRNDADRNALFGIEAITGVTDGGGNHARGNGTGQCSPAVAC